MSRLPCCSPIYFDLNCALDYARDCSARSICLTKYKLLLLCSLVPTMPSAAIAQLKALRAAGKKRLDSYQIEDQGAIYDEVDEEGYKKVVRSRLNQDDFVIDDNGQGYADDGREEWQTEPRYHSSDEEDYLLLKGKGSKRKREEDKEQENQTNHKILNYFNNGPVPSAPKQKVFSEPASHGQS
jgi:hypothetical protein